MRRSRGHAGTSLLIGLVGVIVGAAIVWFAVQDRAPRGAAPLPPAVSMPAPPVSRESQDAITAAVAKVGPAVVNIHTRYRERADPRERILRGMLGVPTEPFPRRGQGSGVIIDGERGYVVTNAHVVEPGADVGVLLQDGRIFIAELVGRDPLSDIAVLKIDAKDLPSAVLGGVGDLAIGSWVVAIGNPFGFRSSVTVGVVSAVDRQIEGPDGAVREDLIQTDASINPGNSGGALVDLNGNVVGIPTAIIPFAQGIGFALSADVARQVAERIIATGKMPWLGIQHRGLAPEEARELSVPEGEGTRVVAVAPGGPAARAGLRPGDVIIRMADQPIADARSLGKIVRNHDAGSRVKVVVWREGRAVTMEVALGEVPQ